MRCPKCQYLSFDTPDRCRNCGYEFSLTSAVPAVDLPIQTGSEPIGPLADLSLEVSSAAPSDALKVPDTVVQTLPRPITSSFDLPLFKERRTADESPWVASSGPSATPRPPLSVRKSTPTPPRSLPRTPQDEPVLGFGFDEPSSTRRAPAPTAVARQTDGEVVAAASFMRRVLALLIDAVILSAIDSIVLYLTLRMCRLPLSRVSVIPPVPFVSFLLLIAGGYFTLFIAAGGQTIGKMAAGIKVVPVDRDNGRVPIGHSVLRAAAYAVSALPIGLGFLPAIVGAEKRAIHDRLADTRVVKA